MRLWTVLGTVAGGSAQWLQCAETVCSEAWSGCQTRYSLGSITQELHKPPEVKKPRYRLSSGASSRRKAYQWLLDLGSNQGPTD